MKVVCCNNINFYNKLTIGKIYNIKIPPGIISDDSNYGQYYFIIDDKNINLGYLKHRFKTLKEYRKQKLEKINESSLH